MFQLYFDVAYI